ncbi:MAG: aminopeptidase N, partial [Gammaproteobacteria bacterium]|nr:aminopeptidase N [Gammaproteobacteria bacterium]
MNIHYRKDYKPSDYAILSTHLTFDIQEHETLVTNVMQMVREKAISAEIPLVLDGEDQELFTLKLNDQHIDSKNYEWTDTALTLHHLPQAFTLTIVSRIHPESNTKLEGLYKSGGIFCTQCEPHGFRRITFYLDRPDVMTLFTTKIIADRSRYPILLSNGNLIEQGPVGAHRHFAVWHDPFKKPSYLFAVVAGNLSKISTPFVTMSGRTVQLEIYSDPTSINQCEYGLQAMKDAMSWDEKRFGREYDLDVYMIVAAEDFNMGAMENKGLNVFNTKYILVNHALSTDMDYQLVQAVIGHEYFHNWTGNRVTCRDWFQLSLKEGLTVFREHEFTADYHGRTLKRISEVNTLRSSQFAEDASPMAHPIRPDSYVEMNNFYTVTVYEKGSEVIRMQHTLLGEPGFRKGMDLYFERHDGQAVTCDDFVKAMEDANQVDFSLFKNWYSEAGTPIVKVKSLYNPQAKTFTLYFEQDRLFHIPIKLGLLSKTGHPIGDELIYSLKEQKAQLVLENVTEHPIPSLLRDFSAPVKLFYDYHLEELALLWEYDSNLFNRWDAGQRFMAQIILHEADPSKALAPIRTILKEASKNPALVAELISIPSIKSLAEMQSKINPEILIQSRETLLQMINTHLISEFKSIYQNTDQHDSVGDRSLKNMCLMHLCAAGEYTEAKTQFDQAQNMTDRLGALTAIVNSNAPFKTDYINQFYTLYQKYPLVVDKWFAVQAASKMPDTVKNVSLLMMHPAFNWKNPNKVYSLVLTFAQNFYQFHQKNGAGYALLGAF